MKRIIYIFGLFLIIAFNANSNDKYLDLTKILEKKNAPIFLAEIESFTVFEIPKLDFRGLKFYPALCIKIIKSYNKILSYNDSILILPVIQTTTERLNDTLTFYNDLHYKIEFKRKIIISIYDSPYYGTNIIGDTGIAFYIDTEPGKSLYKYLEKKYKTKGKKSK